MINRNPYTWTGLGLLIAGIMLSSSAYFIFQLIWLTALGICMLVLSFILTALGKAIPKLSPEVCDLLLETGIDNMATLIEELGVKTKAIYLPSSLASNRPRAFIPLHSNGARPEITKALPPQDCPPVPPHKVGRQRAFYVTKGKPSGQNDCPGSNSS